MKDLTLVHVLAAITVVLGVVMIVRAVEAGGGIGSFGVLIGAIFIAAGVMRLRLLSAHRRHTEAQRAEEER